MAIVKKLDAPPQQPVRRKRVAAYARVSMQTDRLQHSLAAQVSHYSELIQRNPEWIYAGVYVDDAITGTKTTSRAELNRLLADCEAGRIDMILTKSISRFARNTVDLLEMVRHLKELGIAIYFEREKINSLTEDGELMLTLLASFAQEEVRSISENIKWATVKRFKQGIPNGRFTIFGYEWEGDKLVIIPEEAEIIRYMYREYMNGASRIEIGRNLMAKGIYTRKGNQWSDSNVKKILTNITYTGNLLFQKEYTDDPITKHTKINRGELPQYFVENTHEPIIPMDEWQAVQAEFKRRRDLGAFANKSLNTSCFTGKIKCPYCHCSYTHSRKKGHPDYWVCLTKKSKGSTCPVPGTIPHKTLVLIINEVLGLEEFDEKVFLDKVDFIEVPEPHTMVFHMTDGQIITKPWVSTAKLDWWTPERRQLWGELHKHKDTNPNKHIYNEFTGFIHCGCCGANYRRTTQTLSTGESIKRWACPTTPRAKCGNKNILDSTMKRLTAEVLGLENFDESAMDAQIEYAVILNNVVSFHFRDGHTVDKPYLDKRHGTKWSEERREKCCASLKASWTEERRKRCGEIVRERKRKAREKGIQET